MRATLLFAAGWLLLIPSAAGAQTAPQPEIGRRWIVAGASSTTLLGDCTGCAADTYAHSGGVLGLVGARITPRTTGGVEVSWLPSTVSQGRVPIRTTFVMGVLQFRPWLSSGYFVRFSTGMAFVRNWTISLNGEVPPVTSKAFALALSTGWEWMLSRHFGVQAYGAQHFVALGDLTAGDTHAENVVGNIWSVGGAIVIR